MKKNFILVAILLAVGVVNAAFFLDEMDNKAELRIDNLEMLAEGESYGAGVWDDKQFFCYNDKGEKRIMNECSNAFGLGCENEVCPEGYSRQIENKAFYR